MQTDDLILDLAGRADEDDGGFVLPLWSAALIAPVLAAAVFMVLLGPRPDFVASLSTLRFDMKFIEAGLFALTMLAVMAALARPARPWRQRLRLILLPACVLLAAIGVELLVVPEGLWASRAIGQNAGNCLIAIPSIGAPVLALFLFVLSRQAPTHPAVAGAVAGAAAAGIAALFYAAHCPDDSPLFVALWYPLASLILAGAGAFAGGRLLRW
ncbi:NrsF family protein [Jiella sp. MQZ9-1]|uniref:DUF1109 family protein n=1 Tax=Jiella flava TaxID=2816857 RepID=A0A939FVQ6_9HYPH|nr:NrsF family protein [Jiella flava]MBO0662325.1 DUF1109 family protein [Jiella flava]MCD2470846.1 NrsF family protein [Jiella flava]